ncbi:MAG: PepSY domain-containing protein [Gammaproteobacteria bacterium]|nr:PepSY domain-containing protein [Gammaproteobacteria bacterium]MDH5304293.1 PepSY domain-containing protein [Gammaproteobacteria bacterium]
MTTQDVQGATPTTRARHWARRTHRVLGVSAALFLVLISASGLVLNHADALGLPRSAAGRWALTLYGIELPPIDSAFAANEVLFATVADTLYADGAEIAKGVGRLVGAMAIDPVIVVATADEFFITSSAAELIERYAPDAGGLMRALGTDGQRVFVELQHGYAELDPGQMSFVSMDALPGDNVQWSRPATPGIEQVEQLGAAALGLAINWERLLLDLHSGRILPAAGRYLADITALALLYMCFSGIVLWTRRRP